MKKGFGHLKVCVVSSIPKLLFDFCDVMLNNKRMCDYKAWY